VQFSSNVARLEPSATLALAARARQLKADGVPVIDLSAGEPKFPAPEFATRAAIDAIAAGMTGYPPTPGLPALRQAIAKYLVETTACSEVDPAAVLVGAGVKQALFNCTFALFGRGDEVLIPAPFWPSYTAIVELANATPVVVDTPWEEGFIADVDRLEAARTERTRGLFLNSPSNPSGAVYDTGTLTSILEWADRHGIWVLSDEIYRRLAYVDDVPSVYDVEEVPDRVVLLDGVSKAFCMPGFRIGYAVGSRELIKKAADLQGQTTSGAVGPSQMAAAAALGMTNEREAFVADLVVRLAGLRADGLDGLAGIPALDVPAPDGSIYFYAKLTDPSANSMEVAEGLLRDQAVACVPGDPFGTPGFLRFNFAVERETLAEGIRRIQEFFGS
jgi:aspartate aminotransferase